MPTTRIVLDSKSAEDAALVESVAQRLRDGHVVVLPTETVYGLTALPEFEGRIREIKNRAEGVHFTAHLADSHDVGSLPWRAQTLAETFWPGPLTLIVDGPDNTTLGFRLPDHPFTRAVIRACGGTLSMTSVNKSGTPPLNTAAEIEAQFGDELDTLVVDDPPTDAVASTIVRVHADDLEIIRQGGIPEASVRAAAAETILFVCTGNTCRSPLAAAIATAKIRERLGVGTEDLIGRGIRVESAGVATGYSSPASQGSLAVGREMGLDLTDHESQPITADLLDRTRYIFCLARSHAQALLQMEPELAGRVHLLNPDGTDIADPFGGELPIYQRAGQEIEAAVDARIAEIFPAGEG